LRHNILDIHNILYYTKRKYTINENYKITLDGIFFHNRYFLSNSLVLDLFDNQGNQLIARVTVHLLPNLPCY